MYCYPRLCPMLLTGISCHHLNGANIANMLALQTESIFPRRSINHWTHAAVFTGSFLTIPPKYESGRYVAVEKTRPLDVSNLHATICPTVCPTKALKKHNTIPPFGHINFGDAVATILPQFLCRNYKKRSETL